MGVSKMIRFCLMLALCVPVSASALTVEGNSYPDKVTIDSQELLLVGAGLREKWWVDVYTMAAYSQSGSCNPSLMIDKDETKYLRMDLKRDVSAEKMASTIGEAFTEHMPKDASPKLDQQRQQFEKYFKTELTEGTKLEFVYTPNKGTLMKQNGNELGPALEGIQFHKVLWDIYFGKDTCCDGLKEQILKSCKK